MVSKKKLLLLLPVLALTFCVGLFGNTSKVYAGYNRGTTITTDDVTAIFNAIGFPLPSDIRRNNYRDTINGLINSLYSNYSDFRLENMVFFTNNSKFYCVIQNGTVGTSFDYIAINYVSGSASMARYISTIYSGEEIVGFNVDQLNNVYQITETQYNITTNTYPTWTLNDAPMTADGRIVTLPSVVATWNYNSVASQLSAFGIQNDTSANWRFLGNTVQLSGWTPDPTPTPTPTPTNTPIPSGGTDLTETNSKIDDVNQSVQELIEKQSGDHQETIEALTDVPSGDDFIDVSSGDILDSIDFTETVDPYENFWATFISGLNTALTCNNKTTYDIVFLGETYTIDTSDWIIDYPDIVENLLVISWTIGIVFAELKLWRHIIIHINSGNLMNLASNYSKSDITDLF